MVGPSGSLISAAVQPAPLERVMRLTNTISERPIDAASLLMVNSSTETLPVQALLQLKRAGEVIYHGVMEFNNYSMSTVDL